MSRPLHELELRAGVLRTVSEVCREACITIARDKSPSAGFNLASLAARTHGYGGMDAIGIAKATRWLAVIRRDHGDIIFNEAVARLITPTV